MKGYSKTVRNDMILAVSILSLVLAAFLVFILTRKEGASVTVTEGGEVVASYPLSVDRRVELGSGDGYNILVIENGEAHVESASCPDGICVAHRAIRYEGESIACLPNRIVITVTGGESADVDAEA